MVLIFIGDVIPYVDQYHCWLIWLNINPNTLYEIDLLIMKDPNI